MNRKRTKAIRLQVLNDLGYEPNEQEKARDIHKYPEFKKIFRAAKKNYLRRRNSQNPSFV